MNSSTDWDVIWKWHWFRRRLWQPYYKDQAHPEGRPARRSPIWCAILKQCGAETVLDANCGLGLRAILLHREGFRVTGVDISTVATQCARDLAREEAADISFIHSSWTEIGSRFPGRFDAVITDAFAWFFTLEDLTAAVRSMAEALRPGGSLIFTGIDKHSAPSQRHQRAEHAWKSSPRFQIRANYGSRERHMTLVVVRDREPLAIVENFLFVIHENGAVHLETASIRSTLEWTWQDFESACGAAGLTDLDTVQVVVSNRSHHFNVARKPQV